MNAWVPFVVVVAVVWAIPVVGLVVEALVEHRARVDLHVATQRAER